MKNSLGLQNKDNHSQKIQTDDQNNIDSIHNNLWRSITSQLHYECGPDAFMSMIAGLELIKIENNTVFINLAPGTDLKEIEKNYSKKILELWKNEIPEISEIKFNTPVISSVSSPSYHSFACDDENNSSPEFYQTRPDKELSFQNFVVGISNKMAYDAALSIADNLDKAPNPLFIHGNVGLGKTHLLHAITNKIKLQSDKKSFCLISAERFTNLFIQSIRKQEIMEFKEYFRSLDVLLIDDIHFLNHKEGTLEEFFHTFNDLFSNGCKIVTSAINPPAKLNGVGERIQSRLASGLVAKLMPYQTKDRLAIIRSKMKLRNYDLPEEVVKYLAEEIDSNVREIEGAINHLVAYRNIHDKNDFDNAHIQAILQDITSRREKLVSIEDIKNVVAQHFNIKSADLCSASRQRNIVIPRHIAMYLAKENTRASLSAIGKSFGRRDHSTVQHAVNKITKDIYKDFSLQQDIENIRQKIHP